MAQKFPVPHSTARYAASQAYGLFCMRGFVHGTYCGLQTIVKPQEGIVTLYHEPSGLFKDLRICKAWRPGA